MTKMQLALITNRMPLYIDVDANVVVYIVIVLAVNMALHILYRE